VIMDARHPLTPLDQKLLSWIAPVGVPVHVLLSKSDKLTRQHSQASLHSVQSALRDEGFNSSVQLFSSTHKVGITAKWESRKPPKRSTAGSAVDRNKKPPVKGE
jgi:GTP-binding protein